MKRRVFLLALASAAAPLFGAMPADPRGSLAPEWKVKDWLNSPPLRLADLRGKVALVRWWTGPGCPMCEASLPVLEEWWRELRGRGLAVVGFYHHKSPAPLEAGDVARLVGRFRVTFPVATDPDWRTLREWWLDAARRDFTSVTFLVGRDGRVLLVHEGGTIDRASKAGRALEKAVRDALD
jgi:peroxiredoxin